MAPGNAALAADAIDSVELSSVSQAPHVASAKISNDSKKSSIEVEESPALIQRRSTFRTTTIMIALFVSITLFFQNQVFTADLSLVCFEQRH
jgi:hypothetical protein